MTKDGTIAPKERVNIVYRPSQEDAREEVELPLKMLVLGDFTGGADVRPVESREPVNVDRDSFNDILKAHEVSVDLAVANRISPESGEDLQVHLRIESMDDFSPQAVIDQVPELRRLSELREALRALKGPLANNPEFRRKIQEVLGDPAHRQRLVAAINGEQGEL